MDLTGTKVHKAQEVHKVQEDHKVLRQQLLGHKVQHPPKEDYKDPKDQKDLKDLKVKRD